METSLIYICIARNLQQYSTFCVKMQYICNHKSIFSEIKNREHLFIASESHKFGVGMDLVGIWDCGGVCDLALFFIFEAQKSPNKNNFVGAH